MDNRPIGVFDSGLGGLTVLKELMAHCPNEDFVYFGDCGRIPYGSKSEETVRAYTLQDISFLMTQNVKAVVIACNTASSYGYKAACERFDVPLFEVVSPGARAALRNTTNGKIGVIGTIGTVSSGVYKDTIERAFAEMKPAGIEMIEVSSKACPLFVPLAEEGWWNNEITMGVCERYLSELKQKEIDSLVLGCTHYPLLADAVADYMGEDVRLITSGESLSLELKEYLEKNGLESPKDNVGERAFYTSDSIEKFRQLGELFLGCEIENISKVLIDQY